MNGDPDNDKGEEWQRKRKRSASIVSDGGQSEFKHFKKDFEAHSSSNWSPPAPSGDAAASVSLEEAVSPGQLALQAPAADDEPMQVLDCYEDLLNPLLALLFPGVLFLLRLKRPSYDEEMKVKCDGLPPHELVVPLLEEEPSTGALQQHSPNRDYVKMRDDLLNILRAESPNDSEAQNKRLDLFRVAPNVRIQQPGSVPKVGISANQQQLVDLVRPQLRKVTSLCIDLFDVESAFHLIGSQPGLTFLEIRMRASVWQGQQLPGSSTISTLRMIFHLDTAEDHEFQGTHIVRLQEWPALTRLEVYITGFSTARSLRNVFFQPEQACKNVLHTLVVAALPTPHCDAGEEAVNLRPLITIGAQELLGFMPASIERLSLTGLHLDVPDWSLRIRLPAVAAMELHQGKWPKFGVPALTHFSGMSFDAQDHDEEPCLDRVFNSIRHLRVISLGVAYPRDDDHVSINARDGQLLRDATDLQSLLTQNLMRLGKKSRPPTLGTDQYVDLSRDLSDRKRHDRRRETLLEVDPNHLLFETERYGHESSGRFLWIDQKGLQS